MNYYFGAGIIGFGQKVYTELHQQAYPAFGASRWAMWLTEIGETPKGRAWLAKASAVDKAAFAALQAPTLSVRYEEEQNNQPADKDLPRYVGLVTSRDGYSLWSGQYAVPIPDNDWAKVVEQMLRWTVRQCVLTSLPAYCTDIALFEMVLPAPEERKFPNWAPPPALGVDDDPTNAARQGWLLWKKQTGGNLPLQVYGGASTRQWQVLDNQFTNLDAVLGGAEKVLRYASMQEPALRLQEKLSELTAKQATLSRMNAAVSENPEVAAKVLTPAEMAEFNRLRSLVAAEERRLYNILPSSMWQGEPPSGLGGWVVITAIVGTVAIGFIASVSYLISVIDASIAKQRALKLQEKIQQGLEESRMLSLQMQAECIAQVEASKVSEQDKSELRLKCSQQAQATLQVIAQQQANVAQAAAEASKSTPQGEQTNGSGMILLGLSAAVAGYLFLSK